MLSNQRACCRFAAALLLGIVCRTADAQSGLEESLRKLDRNENGVIEPNEITNQARPFMERIATGKRLEIYREHSIEAWRETARIYFALKNGVSGKDIEPEEILDGVRGFTPMQKEPLVPEFGLSEVKYPYNQDDLRQADNSIRRNDRNRDGYIDRREAERGRWTKTDPFNMDFNQDDRLSRLELAQRYARRRLMENSSGQLKQKPRRIAWGSIGNRDDGREATRRIPSRPDPGGAYVTSVILSRFDLNRDGRLDPTEGESLGVEFGVLDLDRDGTASKAELTAYFTEINALDQTGEEEIPDWFIEKDANRDQQISMAEFSEEWSEELIAEFESTDMNGDGLLTASEVLENQEFTGGEFANESADVLAPGKTILSEIEIEDDFLIADLNVRLSITHTRNQYLDVFLIGPDGQRVELFTEVGGSGDHFENTVLDDQSRIPIVKAQAPFKGAFTPEAVAKRQPSLGHFNGKSAQGVWQLMIRSARSDRFGMLNRWALIFTADTESEQGAPEGPADGAETESAVVEAKAMQARASALGAQQEQKPSGDGGVWQALHSAALSSGEEVTSRKARKQASAAAREEMKKEWNDWIKSRQDGKKPTPDEIRAFKESMKARFKNPAESTPNDR